MIISEYYNNKSDDIKFSTTTNLMIQVNHKSQNNQITNKSQ